jgi:hypothetical protein
MHLHSLRLPRIAAAGFAVAIAAAGIALGAAPAHAATAPDITVSLSPTSGTNYTTNAATLSWTATSQAIGAEVDVFIYKGTTAWNVGTINEAEGNSAQSEYYGNFSSTASATSATGSVSWPNVPSAYKDFSVPTTYASTGAMITALGTGLYTIGVAAVSPTTFAPVTDSSGNPVAGSIVVDLGASGDSWSVAQAVNTAITLSGSGTAEKLGNTVSLAANVTAADSSAPVGGVNFYAAANASGKPLNGTTPVPVSKGTATYSGSSGYAAPGPQEYTAVFVPTDTASYNQSTDTTSIDLTFENVTIMVKATQDASSSTTVDLTASATGSPDTLASQAADDVQFVTDGTAGPNVGLSSAGVATTKVTGVKVGKHTFSALLIGGAGGAGGHVLTATDGFNVTVTPATLTTGPVATTTTLAIPPGSSDGLKVTATVASAGGSKAVPAGKVTVKDGSTTVGTVTVGGASGSGKATGTVTDFSLPAGANDFTAAFAPTSTSQFNASSAAALDYNLPTAVTWVQAATPTISGKAAVGVTLTANSGTWGPKGVHLLYQWLAGGTAISGATGSKLTLGTAESGKTVSVQVTGYATGDISWQVTSAATGKVGSGTLSGTTPTISGTAKVGDTLTAHAGSWTSGTSLHYQWLANGKAIGGATKSTYKLPSGVSGKKVQVKVTGTKADYTSLAKTSASTKAVAS